jgi:Tfp pilus assembly protein PilF
MGCYESLKLTGMNKCPYCNTNLAISDFKNGITSTFNLVELGVDKMDKGLDEQAKYYFFKAIDLDSKSVVAWKRLGMLYFSQMNWERAKYCFTKVLKLNPQDKEAKENYIEADHRIRSYY